MAVSARWVQGGGFPVPGSRRTGRACGRASSLGPWRTRRPGPGQAGGRGRVRLRGRGGLPVPAGRTPGTGAAWGFEVRGTCLNLPAWVDAGEDVCLGTCVVVTAGGRREQRVGPSGCGAGAGACAPAGAGHVSLRAVRACVCRQVPVPPGAGSGQPGRGTGGTRCPSPSGSLWARGCLCPAAARWGLEGKWGGRKEGRRDTSKPARRAGRPCVPEPSPPRAPPGPPTPGLAGGGALTRLSRVLRGLRQTRGLSRSWMPPYPRARPCPSQARCRPQ